MARWQGPIRATELTEAWKKITFNQFHDLAAGSGIGIIYKDAQKRLRPGALGDERDLSRGDEDHRVADQYQRPAGSSGAGLQSAGLGALRSWSRSACRCPTRQQSVSVLDAENRVLPSQVLSSDRGQRTPSNCLSQCADVPSLGYEVLHVVPGKRAFASDLKADGLTLENAALRVTVDKTTGCITSLFDKKSGFETLAAGSLRQRTAALQ